MFLGLIMLFVENSGLLKWMLCFVSEFLIIMIGGLRIWILNWWFVMWLVV